MYSSTHPCDPPLAPWIVLKFGGSSVASVDLWLRIEHLVRAHLRTRHRVLLVCSAIASVTDRLEAIAATLDAGGDVEPGFADLAQLHRGLSTDLGLDATEVLEHDLAALRAQIDDHCGPLLPRDRARLLAHGELLSTRIGAAFLAGRGLGVELLDALSLLRACPQPQAVEHFLSATCPPHASPEARARLEATGAEVVITQGFIARDEDGETVLLGRGGSDASAAYLAAAISADAVEIRSDVPGLFTVDPRQYGDACLLHRVSYAEAESLGALGTKALHPRTIEPLRELGIPLTLGSTRHFDVPGTRVTGARAPRGVKAVTARRELALLVMTRPACSQPIDFLAEVAARFQQRGLSMDLFTISSAEIRATLDLVACPSAREQLDGLVADLHAVCRPRVLRPVGSVSLVGTGLAPLGLPCPRLLDELSRLHVHLVAHGPEGTHVTFVVEQSEVADLTTAAHRALLGARPSDDLFGPAWDSLVFAKASSPHLLAARGKDVAA